MSLKKSTTVANAVDTFTDGAKPNRPRHRSARLAIQSGGSGAVPYIYLASPVPLGARVLSAKLRLATSGSWGGASVTLTAQRLTSRFVASKVTHGDAGSIPSFTTTGAVAVTRSSTGDGDWWEFDVTAMLQLVANGVAWYGWRITSNSATRRFLRAAQDDSRRPELVIEWAEASDTPTTLAPSEQAVSIASPTLEMDYNDPTAGVLTSAQVLVSASSAMTSPFDSGEVAVPAGSKAQVNLAATAYPGLALGGIAYWQGRVRDASGEWSAYSAPTWWTRVAKGALVINSPSSASPTLTDLTPTILFAFTPPAGATQEKYQVLVIRTSDGATVYNSGEVAGTASSHVIVEPNGQAVLQLSASYRLVVRVWDTVDRATVAGDPAFVEATRDFTLTTGGVAQPGALDVTALTAPPQYEVTFTRSAAPDSFAALVDGRPVAVDLDPAALFVSGTTYRYRFPAVRGGVDVTLGMVAVENGVMSPVRTTVVSRRTSGVWLVDKLVPSRFLFIAKTGGSTIELSEDGATLTPLGSESSVRITQGLGGYGGSITGVLIGEHGRTLQQWVDEALGMRGRPGRDYVMLVGTEAFECFIGDLKVRPTGDSTPGMRPISFSFGQTDAQRVAVSL